SIENIMKNRGTFAIDLETWEEVVDGRYAIVGSPETVTEQLIEALGKLGCGNILGLFQLGTLPDALTRSSMKLFADEVMPVLRREFPDNAPVLRATAAV
ncbi:MAG: hypothetical protein ACYDD7_12960, partial [Acidimicrobiales bacterium]